MRQPAYCVACGTLFLSDMESYNRLFGAAENYAACPNCRASAPISNSRNDVSIVLVNLLLDPKISVKQKRAIGKLLASWANGELSPNDAVKKGWRISRNAGQFMELLAAYLAVPTFLMAAAQMFFDYTSAIELSEHQAAVYQLQVEQRDLLRDLVNEAQRQASDREYRICLPTVKPLIGPNEDVKKKRSEKAPSSIVRRNRKNPEKAD